MGSRITDTEKKNILLDILKIIIPLLEKHKIRWTAAYGTLLGAVRHQGFIPWDDDIDIYVPRPDFLKLISLLERDKILDGTELTILEYGEHKNSYYQRFKIADKRTTMIEFGKERPAVFVDIFPLDKINGNKSKKERKKILFIDNLIVLSKSNYAWGSGLRSFFMKIILILFRALGREKIISYLTTKLIKKYNKSNNTLIGSAEGGSGPNEFFPIKSFNTIIQIPFEGIMINAPGDYDTVLTILYGDYHLLPPLSERRIHHYDMFWK